MVIIYAYLKKDGNLIACVPFRYNIEDEDVIEAKEVILPVDDMTTYDTIKQKLLEMVDKEKQDYGRDTTGYTGDLPNVVTIQ